jgi:biotin carboxyl carrier protein
MSGPAPGFREATRSPASAAAHGASGGGPSKGVLTAPLPGVVLEVFVAPGAVLHRGDPVLVLEAMKMRNTIRSRSDAVVVEVAVAEGQPVGPGDVLVRLDSLPT